MAAKEKTSRLTAWLAPILLLLAAVAAAQPASALTCGALETRAWEKTSAPLESRPAESLQLLNLHQQNGSAGYDCALGSPLAAKGGANLPADAQQALDDIEQGAARPNVRNPKPFANDGRGGTPQLPTQDAAGNPINYTEHTVNPRPPGGSLDGQRIITGSDGSVWYTNDHFTTWTRVK